MQVETFFHLVAFPASRAGLGETTAHSQMCAACFYVTYVLTTSFYVFRFFKKNQKKTIL